MKNKNKAINNIARTRGSGKWELDMEDPFIMARLGAYNCRLCGSSMHPYKTDQYGDIIMACDKQDCPNAEGFDGSVNVQLSNVLLII